MSKHEYNSNFILKINMKVNIKAKTDQQKKVKKCNIHNSCYSK